MALETLLIQAAVYYIWWWLLSETQIREKISGVFDSGPTSIIVYACDVVDACLVLYRGSVRHFLLDNFEILNSAKAISCYLSIDVCYSVSSQEGQNRGKFAIFFGDIYD